MYMYVHDNVFPWKVEGIQQGRGTLASADDPQLVAPSHLVPIACTVRLT